MKDILIIIFTMSLIYLAVAGRFVSFVRVLGLQGLLLLGIAYMELRDSEVMRLGNLVFILLETLLFKSIIVPYFFNRIIKRNKLSQEAESNFPSFFSLITVSLSIILTFILAYKLHEKEELKVIYFTASVSAIFTGVFLMITRKTIVTHIVGYMVLENGIFLLSLAIGAEMPMIVNIGILLDLLSSILILGFFVNRIGDVYKTIDVEKLTELKD
jgi:hydrogenase-4 component E